MINLNSGGASGVFNNLQNTVTSSVANKINGTGSSPSNPSSTTGPGEGVGFLSWLAGEGESSAASSSTGKAATTTTTSQTSNLSAEDAIKKADSNDDGQISKEEIESLDDATKSTIEELGGFDAVAGIDGNLDMDELKAVLSKASGKSSPGNSREGLQQDLISNVLKVLNGALSNDKNMLQEGLKGISQTIKAMDNLASNGAGQ